MTTVEELPNPVGFRLVPAQPILWQRPMEGGRVEMLLHVFIIRLMAWWWLGWLGEQRPS